MAKSLTPAKYRTLVRIIALGGEVSRAADNWNRSPKYGDRLAVHGEIVNIEHCRSFIHNGYMVRADGKWIVTEAGSAAVAAFEAKEVANLYTGPRHDNPFLG